MRPQQPPYDAESTSWGPRLEAWQRERLPLDAAADAIRHKTVPVHRHSFA